jgi:outer membrane protein W
MSTIRNLITLTAICMPITSLAQTAGDPNTVSLRGRHEITLSIGMLSALSASSEVSVANVDMTSEVNGLIGSIGYAYWFSDEWAAGVSVGMTNADASMSVSGAGAYMESAAVYPLLIGLEYKPRALAIGSALRPNVYAYIGPYFGYASDVRAGWDTGAESYSEMALGSLLGAGLDLSLGKRFTLGAAVGYRFVTDFERRIGSEKNHSSPEFSLSLGFAIGG